MKFCSVLMLTAAAMTNVIGASPLHAVAQGRKTHVHSSFALSEPDRAAILANVRAFADSWNKHDMNAMHALDTPDVEWINVVGNDWRGVENVRKGHTNFLHTIGARDVSTVEAVTVRSIARDVAIAVTNFRFRSPKPDGKIEDTRTRGSFVMVRRAGIWKIAQFQNTVINPGMEGPGDPVNFDETTGLPKVAR